MAETDIEFSSNGHTLVGMLNTPSSAVSHAALLLHPHPRFGGSMDNLVVRELEQIAIDSGMATLRFNFRGATSNPFSFDGVSGAVDDAMAALNYMKKELGTANLGLLGYSFGASVGLGVAAQERLSFLVCLSASYDIFLSTGLKLDALSTIDCPVLLFHGMDDTVISPQDADRFSYAVGSNSEVVQIADEGHFYQNSMNRVRIRIKDFLRAIL
ncbi:hypothetical protein EU537_09185 [Candidatus Thorarchaeota archaeon]|nr:MAG: hypothetical protein EU537_09185 [Candidatus Thorarchaeota archaeon]